ncbi:MAG TPA: adenylate/guanylate cyclase domain-containing protein [Candidatus Binatia bacterium]|jgi:adenylate cyclase|nr:adenylate/guanylate cyclase domain-containing protein [Candidatus Binatia bacterium]
MNDHTSNAASIENRRLAAIMFTDIVGFSRQMGSNEAHLLQLLEVHNQMIRQAVATHHGAIIKIMGDAFLVDFPSVVNAVQCAQTIQAHLRTYNAEKETNEQIHIRIGIHSGDIVQRDGDIFGDGVNIASRLQGLAAPDTICLSQAVYKEIEKKLPVGTVVSLGRPKLKNIAQREPVYVLLPEPPKGFRLRLHVQRLKLKQWRRALQVVTAVLVLAWAGVVTLRSFRSPSPLGQPQGATPTDAAPLPLPDKPSIVVLPFTNMSNDPEQEYFSDGITEDITSDLSQISSLFVIARNSAFTYKGKAVKVQDVSKEMGVRYVLEGSVRKSGDLVRVTAQLIDGPTGGHVWSERYDRPLTDIFTVQDEVTQHIVAALRVEVMEAEMARVRRVPTENLTAYDLSLRGMELVVRAWNETKKEANEQARQMFEQAIALDPQYARAYSGLSLTCFLDWFSRWSSDPIQAMERAVELGQRAIALEDSLPSSHALLGHLYMWKSQYEQAIAEGERAIALDPNNAEGFVMLGNTLVFAGRPREAIGLIEKAMRLNPRYPVRYLATLGIAYTHAGQCEKAIPLMKKFLAVNPNVGPAHYHLAICNAEVGQLEEARTEVAEMLRLQPHVSVEWLRQNGAYKDLATLERHLAALRKAGLK